MEILPRFLYANVVEVRKRQPYRVYQKMLLNLCHRNEYMNEVVCYNMVNNVDCVYELIK